MVIENCKKIEPVVVKLPSKTKYTTFSEHAFCTSALASDECRWYRASIGEPECVSDLGVTIVKNLYFSEHIANITRKAHQRANLIHRCFISKNTDLLVRAFKTYVRPISYRV